MFTLRPLLRGQDLQARRPPPGQYGLDERGGQFLGPHLRGERLVVVRQRDVRRDLRRARVEDRVADERRAVIRRTTEYAAVDEESVAREAARPGQARVRGDDHVSVMVVG